MDNKEKTTEKAMKRRFTGVVVCKSGEKTVKVRVAKIVKHPKYLKRYWVHKYFLAHDPKNTAEVGQKVEFEQCRPISKSKKWRLIYRDFE